MKFKWQTILQHGGRTRRRRRLCAGASDGAGAEAARRPDARPARAAGPQAADEPKQTGGHKQQQPQK